MRQSVRRPRPHPELFIQPAWRFYPQNQPEEASAHLRSAERDVRRGMSIFPGPMVQDARFPPPQPPYPMHECGIFGVFGHPNAAVLTYYGLFALQHRGQESAGIVTSNGPGSSFQLHRDMGLVSQVFGQDELERLKGTRAVGHTRYSTTGSSTVKNAQPFVVDCFRGQLAIAHNGNLINADVLRDELERKGSIFQTTADSEIILHLLAQPSRNGGNILTALRRIEGAFSLIIMSEREIIAVRDPFGFRPLVVRQTRWRLCPRLRNLRLRSHSRGIHPRNRAGRSPHHQRRRPSLGMAVPGREAGVLHVRIRLLRAARQHHRRRQRRQSADRDGARAGAKIPGRGRHRRAGARLGKLRRARLRRTSSTFPTNTPSFATTTSGAPFSSRASSFATSMCG